MELILITPEQKKTDELKLVNDLFDEGLPRLHIRKTNFAVKDYADYIRRISEIHHSKLVLHGGGFELLSEFNIRGLHFNSQQLADTQLLDRWFNNHSELTKSGSFHHWTEIAKFSYPLDYAFISPVFDSISKTDYKAGIGLSGLGALRKYMNDNGQRCPRIYGMGGIDSPHLKVLSEYHFDGAVVYGAIWKSPQPITYLRSILLQLSNQNSRQNIS